MFFKHRRNEMFMIILTQPKHCLIDHDTVHFPMQQCQDNNVVTPEFLFIILLSTHNRYQMNRTLNCFNYIFHDSNKHIFLYLKGKLLF